MTSIFYDLETTDIQFVGQIINYAFVVVDDDWNIIDSLVGDVKISRLQLPTPSAILANRVFLGAHQVQADKSEPEVMYNIREFLQKYVEKRTKGEKIQLIGYNSNKFDLPFLRTSMLRNGINPYFSKHSIQYKDLYHLTQKLATTNINFTNVVDVTGSLSLEKVTNSLKLLSGKQDHHSLSDVNLSIKLARHYANTFGIDIRKWSAFEVDMEKAKDSVVSRVMMNGKRLENKNEVPVLEPKMLLLDYDEKGGQSLWINLSEYDKNPVVSRDMVHWFNHATGIFLLDADSDIDHYDTATEQDCDIRNAFASSINLSNYFPPKNCDVEQFIYMMNFEEKDALYEAIWMNDLSRIKSLQSKNASELLLRYCAAHKDINDPVVEKIFRKYCAYRYGGKMKISKENYDIKYQPGIYSDAFHPTYNEYLSEIDEKINSTTTEAMDKELLISLKEFILNSDINFFCGTDLAKINRVKVTNA